MVHDNNDKFGGISSETVKDKTGKIWDEWLHVLDKEGAKAMTHKDIADLLYDKDYIKSGWWCQAVTVGYEQARGLRNKHEKPDGYEVSVSKVIEASLSKLYDLASDESKREKWLLHKQFVVTKANENKNIRFKWDNNSSGEIRFYPKDEKTQLVVQHSRLKSAAEAEKMREFWKSAIEKLITQL